MREQKAEFSLDLNAPDAARTLQEAAEAMEATADAGERMETKLAASDETIVALIETLRATNTTLQTATEKMVELAQGAEDVKDETEGAEESLAQLARAARSEAWDRLRDGLREISQAAVDMGSNIDGTVGEIATAQRTLRAWGAAVGLTADAMENLGRVGQLAGGQFADAAEVGDLIQELGDRAVEAARGQKEYAAQFAALGVAVVDQAGNIRPASEVFIEVSDALGRMQNETEAMAIAGNLMTDIGRNWIATVRDQGGSLSDLMSRMEAFGHLTAEQREGLKRYEDATAELRVANERLAQVWASEAGPKLARFKADVADLLSTIVRHNPDLATFVGLMRDVGPGAASAVGGVVQTAAGLKILGVNIGSVVGVLKGPVGLIALCIAAGLAFVKLDDVVAKWSRTTDQATGRTSRFRESIASLWRVVRWKPPWLRWLDDWLRKAGQAVGLVNELDGNLNGDTGFGGGHSRGSGAGASWGEPEDGGLPAPSVPPADPKVVRQTPEERRAAELERKRSRLRSQIARYERYLARMEELAQTAREVGEPALEDVAVEAIDAILPHLDQLRQELARVGTQDDRDNIKLQSLAQSVAAIRDNATRLVADFERLKQEQREALRLARARGDEDEIRRLENELADADRQRALITGTPDDDLQATLASAANRAELDNRRREEAERQAAEAREARERELSERVRAGEAKLKVAGVEGDQSAATRELIESLKLLEAHYRASGDEAGYFEAQLKRLTLEMGRQEERTLAEQLLMAGPGAGAVTAFLRGRGALVQDAAPATFARSSFGGGPLATTGAGPAGDVAPTAGLWSPPRGLVSPSATGTPADPMRVGSAAAAAEISRQGDALARLIGEAAGKAALDVVRTVVGRMKAG